MQRVVRSTFAGLLALAAITACGDKVTVPGVTTQAPSTVVHSVTVTPASLTMSIGQKAVVVASVDADAGVTDRTVTWTSSNAAVATVDASGNVTAVGAGTASIIAASHFDATVKGAALVTVGAVQNAAVTISAIKSNATGNLVNQNAVAGQIDVAINFTPGSQAVSAIQLAMNCNAAGGFPAASDTVVAQQVLSSNDIAVLGGDAASADIINLSVNTAAFNSGTGVVAFKNGACVLKAKAVTTSGTQVASNSASINLTNTDFLLFGISTTPTAPQLASATDANGQLWNAGAVNVTAVPVIFTAGRSITSGSISLVNAGGDNAGGQAGALIGPSANIASLTGLTPASGSNVFSATFPNSTTATAGVGGATVDTLGVTVTTVDNSGNAGPGNTASPINFIRLDNAAPNVAAVPATFTPPSNTANGWLGAASTISASAVSATNGKITLGSASTDNATTIPGTGGVGKVTFTTLVGANGAASSTFTPFTSITSLPETATGTTDGLRLNVCDALNNCVVTAQLTNTLGPATGFGVDLTPPTLAIAAGSITNNTVFAIGSAPAAPVNTGLTDPQGANGVTGSGFGANPVLTTETQLTSGGTAATASPNSVLNCVIGTANAPAGTGCKAAILQTQNVTGVVTNPGVYTLTVQAIDQAGNTSAASTVQYLVDQQAPTLTGGIAIPASVAAGSSFTTTVADSMDVAIGNAALHYPLAVAGVGSGTAIRVLAPGSLSATGVAFDNVLTRSATLTVALQSGSFYRSLASSTTPATIVALDSLYLRALDAAGNLSLPDSAAIPSGNIGTGTAFNPASTTSGFTGFTVAVSPAAVSNGTGTGARSTTITATVAAASQTVTSPFSTVCFYVVTPNGAQSAVGNAVTAGATNDLSSLGCTSTVVTVDNAGSRVFNYTLTPFDPPLNTAAGFGSTGGTINIVAIGSNAAGDGLITATPAVLTLNN